MWTTYSFLTITVSLLALLQGKKVVVQFETTPLEYLDMAGLSYADHSFDDKPEHRMLSAQGWQILSSPGKTDFLRKGAGGYRGIVYLHDERKEIVCAHRGTASLEALKADMALVVENKVHPQLTESIETCLDTKVRDLLSQGYSLTFTGHSLGGFLATTNLYLCQRSDLLNSKGESFHFPNSKAIVFDPAGNHDFINAMEPHATSHAGLGDEGIKNLNIMHFVSLPNYVNAYAPHSGGTIYALFPKNISLDKMNPVTYLSKTHSLANLRNCFYTLDSGNFRAGYPKADQCRKVSDWPLINLKELSSLGTVFGSISASFKLSMDALQTIAKKTGHSSERRPFYERLVGGEEYREALDIVLKPVGNRLFNKKVSGSDLNKALKSHYIVQQLFYDYSLHYLHFGEELGKFLTHYKEYLQATPSATYFAEEMNLTEKEVALLDSYKIELGEITISSNATIFTFRSQIAQMFEQNNLASTSVIDWIKKIIGDDHGNITTIKERLSKIEQHRNSINICESQIIGVASAMSCAPGSKSDTKNKFTENQFLPIMEFIKTAVDKSPNANVFFASSMTATPNSTASVENDFTVQSNEESVGSKKKRNIR